MVFASETPMTLAEITASLVVQKARVPGATTPSMTSITVCLTQITWRNASSTHNAFIGGIFTKQADGQTITFIAKARNVAGFLREQKLSDLSQVPADLCLTAYGCLAGDRFIVRSIGTVKTAAEIRWLAIARNMRLAA